MLFPHEHKFLTSRENLKVERAFLLQSPKKTIRELAPTAEPPPILSPRHCLLKEMLAPQNPKLEQLLYFFSDASVAVLATRVSQSCLRVEERRE